MLGLSANIQYFLCCKPVDMRNGFDGLAGIVRDFLKQDPIGASVLFILRKICHLLVAFIKRLNNHVASLIKMQC